LAYFLNLKMEAVQSCETSMKTVFMVTAWHPQISRWRIFFTYEAY
jgi:hypothetical protein